MQLAIQRTSSLTANSPVTTADPGTFASFDDLLRTAVGDQAVMPAGSSKLPVAMPATAVTANRVGTANLATPQPLSSRKDRPAGGTLQKGQPIVHVIVAPNAQLNVPPPPATLNVPVTLPQTSSPLDNDVADLNERQIIQLDQPFSPGNEKSSFSTGMPNFISVNSVDQPASSGREAAPPQQGEVPVSSSVDETSSAAPDKSPATSSSKFTLEVPPVSFTSTPATATPTSQLVPMDQAKHQTSTVGKRVEGVQPASSRAHAARSVLPAKNANTAGSDAEAPGVEPAQSLSTTDPVSPAESQPSRPSGFVVPTTDLSEPSRIVTPLSATASPGTAVPNGTVALDATPANAPSPSITAAASGKRDTPPSSADSSPGTKTSGEGDFTEQVSKLVSAKSQAPAQDQLPITERGNTKASTPVDTAPGRAASQVTTPSGTPDVQNAHFVQTPSRSEMRVDLHSQEFGFISVHSTLKRDSVWTQITLQDTQLSTALSTHVHEMEQKLAKDHGFRASVSVIAQDGSGSSSEQQQQQRPSSMNRRSPEASRKETQDGTVASEHAPANHLSTSSTQPSTWPGNQVDVRI